MMMLKSGDHVIVMDDVYGGISVVLTKFNQFNIFHFITYVLSPFINSLLNLRNFAIFLVQGKLS